MQPAAAGWHEASRPGSAFAQAGSHVVNEPQSMNTWAGLFVCSPLHRYLAAVRRPHGVHRPHSVATCFIFSAHASSMCAVLAPFDPKPLTTMYHAPDCLGMLMTAPPHV